MHNVNIGSNPGVRHAYAYGHVKKEAAQGFKDAITNDEDKPTVAKSFKELIGAAEVKPEETEVKE